MNTTSTNHAPPYFQTEFAAGEFARRRQAVAEEIHDGIAILQGLPDSGAFSVFRQHNDFYYLCGVESPHAYLTIDGTTGRSTLYLLPRDEAAAKSEGSELNADDAEQALRLTGVDDVRPMPCLFDDISPGCTAYLCHAPAEGRQACQDTLRHARAKLAKDPGRSLQSDEEAFIERLSSRRSGTEIRDLSPILARMRLTKSPPEIQLMRRAGDITAQAVVEAMRSTSPGAYEYELAAIADYVFQINGARGGGYRPIVAGGANIWNMHYYRNNCRLEDGDLVLMDYAPDLAGYTSDIGRMWPVNGTYSPPQRELYAVVVDFHQTLLDLIRPGETAENIRQEAAQRMQPIVSRTRWSKPTYYAAIERLFAEGKPFTHPVGMTVHDVGDYRDEPLRPGVVFALDPQLWVPEEQLYVRVEDTVAVTETGCENFTQRAPHDLGEVESLVGSGGLLQSFPPIPAASAVV